MDRFDKGNDRESLWSVAAVRLPYYLLSYALVVGTVTVAGALATVTGGFWTAVVAIAALAGKVATGTIGALIVVEGVIMGLTKMVIDRARDRARAEGIQQGIQQGIRQGIQQERKRLREAGVPVPPDNEPTKPADEDRPASK